MLNSPLPTVSRVIQVHIASDSAVRHFCRRFHEKQVSSHKGDHLIVRNRLVECQREIAFSYLAIVITIVASFFALEGVARSVVEAAALHGWGTMIVQSS